MLEHSRDLCYSFGSTSQLRLGMWGRKKLATAAVTSGASGFSGFSQLQDTVGSEPIAPMAALSFGLANSDSPDPSLREIVKSRLLTDMIRGVGVHSGGVVLCVDHFTLRIVSSTIKMSELLDENIQLVENITMKDKSDNYLKRQPLPGMRALYFITPTVESVNRLLNDYRNRKSPMYGAIYLFFTSRCAGKR